MWSTPLLFTKKQTVAPGFGWMLRTCFPLSIEQGVPPWTPSSLSSPPYHHLSRSSGHSWADCRFVGTAWIWGLALSTQFTVSCVAWVKLLSFSGLISTFVKGCDNNTSLRIWGEKKRALGEEQGAVQEEKMEIMPLHHHVKMYHHLEKSRFKVCHLWRGRCM